MSNDFPPEMLLEISSHSDPGYKPLVDFDAWRVALMRHSDDLLPEKIEKMQRHDETDEVFVLLSGLCILFLGDGEDTITRIHAVEMQKGKLYNVKKGVWHTHVFSPNALVLIVENRDTSDMNSPFLKLSTQQKKYIVSTCESLKIS